MASQHGEENKYKVGDYVYIEQSQENPLVIRRIDELQKTAQGNVAAKVISFYVNI
jgi:metastasis-associated protein MTA